MAKKRYKIVNLSTAALGLRRAHAKGVRGGFFMGIICTSFYFVLVGCGYSWAFGIIPTAIASWRIHRRLP